MTTTDTLDKVLALSMLITTDLQRFEEAHGVTTSRVQLLWNLGASGPCTQRALADALDVTPRNITGLVDGLVGSGHVTREKHPTDRRATHVTLTPKGTALVAEMQTSHAHLADQLFGDMDKRRLADFTRALDATVARFAGLMEADA